MKTDPLLLTLLLTFGLCGHSQTLIETWTFSEPDGTELGAMMSNLRVRMQVNLVQAGEPGSLQIFLKLGTDDEVRALSDGVVPDGTPISGFRVLQQTRNGMTDWQEGDVVTVDDFTLSVL